MGNEKSDLTDEARHLHAASKEVLKAVEREQVKDKSSLAEHVQESSSKEIKVRAELKRLTQEKDTGAKLTNALQRKLVSEREDLKRLQVERGKYKQKFDRLSKIMESRKPRKKRQSPVLVLKNFKLLERRSLRKEAAWREGDASNLAKENKLLTRAMTARTQEKENNAMKNAEERSLLKKLEQQRVLHAQRVHWYE